MHHNVNLTTVTVIYNSLLVKVLLYRFYAMRVRDDAMPRPLGVHHNIIILSALRMYNERCQRASQCKHIKYIICVGRTKEGRTARG